MRFIAQMTIYNSADFDRLHQFISESYHPDLLVSASVDERVTEFRRWYQSFGKIRVKQVVGTGKHHVIVLVETQAGDGYFLNELKVEEDYPHRVIAFGYTPLGD